MSAVATGLAAAERSEHKFRELSPFGEDARRRINEAGRALLALLAPLWVYNVTLNPTF